MRATLRVINGPLEGSVFELRPEMTAGRDPSNEICVPEQGVSRRHCVFEEADGEFTVRDLGSRNGVLLNGHKIDGPAPLTHGDELRIGHSHLVFESGGEAATQVPPVVTMVLRREDASYLKGAAPPANPRTVSDLKALVEFSAIIHSVDSEAELFDKLVGIVLEATRADRAAIVLVDEANGGGATALGRDREGTPRAPEISRTILARVLNERASVLSNDVTNDDTLATSASLAARRVASALAAPLESRGAIEAVLYLESGDSGVRFAPADLELLTALGNIASLAMANVKRLESLKGENRRLEQELGLRHDIVGNSKPVRDLLRFISRMAPLDSTILITGESGTGKELVARAIHTNGRRKDKPFVAINCAALSETLLESELFGHEKGAFTGATAQKKGKIELAEGGTLFLDEAGEMSPALQTKFLRVLQEREYERVGGMKTLKADIRVVAATHRDLKELSETGAFRKDLYFRLNVLHLVSPALRDRKDDIPLLAGHFVQHYAQRIGRRVTGISPQARECLVRYDWPGNIRELQNAIERGVAMGNGESIQPEDLPEQILESGAAEPGGSALHDRLNEAKRQILQRAIAEANNNYTEAAHRLGIHPNHLFRLVKTLNLTPKRQRAPGS